MERIDCVEEDGKVKVNLEGGVSDQVGREEGLFLWHTAGSILGKPTRLKKCDANALARTQ